jgi:hypothetical protein
MRWAGLVARMERREVHAGFWWGSLGERDHLKDIGVDGMIILQWSLKWGGCIDWIDLARECGNTFPGSIKCWYFLST